MVPSRMKWLCSARYACWAASDKAGRPGAGVGAPLLCAVWLLPSLGSLNAALRYTWLPSRLSWTRRKRSRRHTLQTLARVRVTPG